MGALYSSLPNSPLVTFVARTSSDPERLVGTLATLLSIFAILTLALATIGLQGVVNYVVGSRTREVGLRMALGADEAAVKRLLTASGARLVILGSVLGLALAFPVARLLDSQLFGVGAFDPVAFVGTGLLLAATTLLAACVPASRASRLDPVVALRAD